MMNGAVDVSENDQVSVMVRFATADDSSKRLLGLSVMKSVTGQALWNLLAKLVRHGLSISDIISNLSLSKSAMNEDF